MPEPILIGIHGIRGVGKDTTANFIKEFVAASDPPLRAERRGFADKMKWAYMRQWFPTITMAEAIAFVDKWKNDPNAKLSGVWSKPVEEGSDKLFVSTFIPPITMREAMDQFATEGARQIYGEDFWIEQLLPRGNDRLYTENPAWWYSFTYKVDENSFDVADICIVADVRVENEVDLVREHGGWLVKVKRVDVEQKVAESYADKGYVHQFARPLDDMLFDFVINNNDNNLVNARDRTETMMRYIMRGERWEGPMTIT